MNSIEEAALAVVRALQGAGIDYLLVGSFSSNFYGIPRSTHDADFVLELHQGAIRELRQHLPPELELIGQQSFELVTGTTKHVIQVHGNGFVIELFHLSNDPHDQQRFARRRSVTFLGETVSLASPEDVVITKLRWGRGKDDEDIQNVIAVQGHLLDWDYLYRWCEEHGTRPKLDAIRASLADQVDDNSK